MEHNLNCKRCTSEFKHTSTRKKYCPLCEVLQKREKVSRFRNKKRKLIDIDTDTDRDPDSTKNFLKNENNCTETVPFLEECKIIDSDKAEFILFDVSSEIKKSESLSDWTTLVHTYGDYEGDVFEYKPYETTEDGKKWTKTGSNCKMKLREWNVWFQNEQKKPMDER
jgi:hypothetical protein